MNTGQKEAEGKKDPLTEAKEYQRPPEDDVFTTEEIQIEELAIDGICGVY